MIRRKRMSEVAPFHKGNIPNTMKLLLLLGVCGRASNKGSNRRRGEAACLRHTADSLSPAAAQADLLRDAAGIRVQQCFRNQIILFLSSFYLSRFTADRLGGGKKCIDFVF